MAHKEALRRARALRERFRNRGTTYTQAEYEAALTQSLRDLSGDLFEASVHGLAERVDRESTRPDCGDQPDLPGFDLEGDYKVGDGVRIAKRHAQLQHAEMAMALDDQNLIAVQQAVAAYQDANPESR